MKIRGKLEHYFNPLHVYCRLRDVGMDKQSAMRWTKRYSRLTKVPAVVAVRHATR